MTEQQFTYPPNFKSVVKDFTSDLSITFPEYSYLWKKWENPDLTHKDLQTLYEYCVTIYPERFFDILNQNNEIFDTTNDTNTVFLPNIDFKLLFNCKDISENTIKAMWKYLQLMLFTIVGGMKDKADFGETMNMFDGIDEDVLQNKLNETIGSMSDFFKNIDTENPDTEAERPDIKEGFKNIFENMPNAENIQEHLKGLFDGKIGKMAKEMADDIAEDFTEIFGGDTTNINSTQDVLKELMKNPKKIMDLMKKVGGKLDTKMKSGEFSREELMKEASEMMGKMKGMGGGDGKQFEDLFKTMAKGMGGLGKGAKIDTNAMANSMERMNQQQATRERLRKKMELKQQQKIVEALKLQEQQKKQLELQAAYSLQHNEKNPNNMVFRIEGAEQQEKSFIHPDLIAEMEADDKKAAEKKAGGNKTGGKKKKTKK